MNSELVAFGTKSRKRAAAASAKRRYPARIARQLALAHALQRRVEAGEFADYADMARALGFTRARITQISCSPRTSKRRSSTSRWPQGPSPSASAPSATTS